MNAFFIHSAVISVPAFLLRRDIRHYCFGFLLWALLACRVVAQPIWTQITPTNALPAVRQGHTAVYDATNNRLILFGGSTGNINTTPTQLNDVWVLVNADGTGGTASWTQLSPTGGPPQVRSYHSAVYDSANNRMIIFGGNPTVGSCNGGLQDVWVLSNANGLGGTPAWTKLTPTGGPPSPRNLHAAAYDAVNNRMMISGGLNPCNASVDDVWVLSKANGLGGTPAWTQLSISGTTPTGRQGHSLNYDPTNNRLILFAGYTSAGQTNDVWTLSRGNGIGGSSTWTRLSPTGSLPLPRSYCSAQYDASKNSLIFFGGSSSAGNTNDLWVLSNANGSSTPSWTRISTTGTLPSTRDTFGSGYRPANSSLMIFGGRNCATACAPLNDAWALSLSTNTTSLPVITGFSPPAGIIGDDITIAGSNFVGVTAVFFNGTLTTFTNNSSTLITASVPGGATTGPISVVTTNGTVTTFTNFVVNPFITVPLQPVPMVAAGAYHSLVLKQEGTIWGWGSNVVGQLGDNSITERHVPVQTSGLTNGLFVDAGDYHSVAVRTNGTVWAWGTNPSGQLGDNTTTPEKIPVQSVGLSNAVAVAGGYGHCAALKSDGTVWTWGANSFGQLGNSNTTERWTPGIISGISNAVSIAVSSYTTTILKQDGTVWATGQNAQGQLGNGTSNQPNSPVQVTNLSMVASIACGVNYAMALRQDGSVWSWGYNGSGQLGDGTTNTRYAPVQVLGLSNIVSIACGSFHSAAMEADGTLWMWGLNSDGQLGDGTTNNQVVPQRIAGISGIVSLSGGLSHTVALKADGSVWTWGLNANGQLGNGSTTNSLTPLQLTNINCGNPLRLTTLATLRPVLISNECHYFISGLGGTTPYSWAITSNALPNGLVLNTNTGEISGTPTVITNARFRVRITSADTQTVQKDFSLSITAPLSIGTGSILPSGTVGAPYNAAMTLTGSAAPYIFSVVSNSLPAGLNLDASTGSITGVPSTAGVFGFRVRLSGGDAQVVERDFQITIYSPMAFLTRSPLVHGRVGVPYTTTLTATGGVPPYSWAITSNALPPGLILTEDGSITGTPTQTLVSTFRVRAMSADNLLIEKEFNLLIGTRGTYRPLAVGSDDGVSLNTNGTVWTWQVLDYPPVQIGGISNAISVAMIPGSFGRQAIAVLQNGTVSGWQFSPSWTPTNAYTASRILGLSNVIDAVPGLAVKADGTLSTWGYRPYGLGDGNITDTATNVPGITNIVMVARGEDHALALKSDGTVWSWGKNDYGQLGLGNYVNTNTPQLVLGLTNVVAIAAGLNHSVALLDDGTVWAWGDNFTAQLGEETSLQQRPVPGQIRQLTQIVAIAGGSHNTYAVKNDGVLWGCGDNHSGEISADGALIQVDPIPIMGGNNLPFNSVIAIACGMDRPAVVRANGTVWTWGLSGAITRLTPEIIVNFIPGSRAVSLDVPVLPESTVGQSYNLTLRGLGGVAPLRWFVVDGQLPDGLQLNTDSGTLTGTPTTGQKTRFTVRIVENTGDYVEKVMLLNVNAITTSNQLAAVTLGVPYLATLQVAGAVPPYTWSLSSNMLPAGLNLNANTGEISGVPTAAGSFRFRVRLTAGNGDLFEKEFFILVSVPGGYHPTIAGGHGHSVTLDANGNVWAFGFNYAGQVGNGLAVDQFTPVHLDSPSGIIDIAVGGDTSAALQADGTVWTWGLNNHGQVGDGTTTNRLVPVKVNGLSNVVSIALSPIHSAALTRDGKLWTWGYNASGHLADPLVVERHTPGLVTNIDQIAYLAPGGSIAMRNDGSVWQWGYLLGTSITSPTQVNGLSNIIAAAGLGHRMALKADGSVWCWGANGNGQLGDNTINPRTTPVRAIGITNAIAVAAGANHSLALHADGTVSAWGDNFLGELGMNVGTELHTPAKIPGLTNIIAIAAGEVHSLALRKDGVLWAWGGNGNGGLGDGSGMTKYFPVTASGYYAGDSVTLMNVPQLPAAAGGTPYSTSLRVLGGTPPYTWTIASNAVPSGLTLAPNSGDVSGTPIIVITGQFRVRVTDATGLFAEKNFSLAISPGVDSIGDGIPDWWRALYFGGSGQNTNAQSCATCDADQTGQNNLTKYLAGLNPTNPSSVFGVVSLTMTNNGAQIVWHTTGGKVNTVLASSLIDGPFTNIAPSFTIPGSGETNVIWIDSGASNNVQRFYRIGLIP